MKHARSAALAAAAFFPTAALAQEAAPASETSVFLFNTLFFLICGMLVMFMGAGFCMLEAGLVRARSAASISLKVIAAFSVAGIMVWLTGYNLIYDVEPGGFLGQFGLWTAKDIDPVGDGVASSAAFFYQLALAATAAFIVSGAIAERARLLAFLIFTAAFSGFIYPIAASWDWGGGYLEADWTFADFGGATIVHSAGGWAALAAALVIGPRRGKYQGRRVAPIMGSSLPLAALGAFILWFGWFGLIGGAQLSFGSIGDALAVAGVFVNANLAASGGVLAAVIMTSLIYKRVDLTIVLNGAVGGLVSITADPMTPAIWQVVLIGAFGGVIVTAGAPLLDRLRIDDVVGAIPAHLFCGIWGTLVVPWTNPEASMAGQIVGVLMVGAFVFTMSALVWVTLKYSIGARIGAEQEFAGLDRIALGQDAYPEFGRP